MVYKLKNNLVQDKYILVTPTFSDNKTMQDILIGYKEGTLTAFIDYIEVKLLQDKEVVTEQLSLTEFLKKVYTQFKNHTIITENCLNTQIVCSYLNVDNHIIGVDLLQSMFRRKYNLKEIISFINSTGSGVAVTYTDVVRNSLARYKENDLSLTELLTYSSFTSYFQAIEKLYVTDYR